MSLSGRTVISTLAEDGKEVMGSTLLLYHYPDASIVNGSLLTVENNQFCVLKARGAILNIFETGQYPVQTPDKPILGSIQQAFFGGNSPFQYEAMYVNRAKLVGTVQGTALSKEMAELLYNVSFYVHVDSKDDALKLVTHMPYSGHALNMEQFNAYIMPVIEQALNQILQVTELERINERIHDITDGVKAGLQEFLTTYGVTLNDVKVQIMPNDPLMKSLISLKAFGLEPQEAVRALLAKVMAEKGVISAPNMMAGAPFQIGTSLPLSAADFLGGKAPRTANEA